MKIELQLFAAAREALDRSEIACELPSVATVADLRNHLSEVYPEIRALLSSTRFAKGVSYVGDDQPLQDGDHLALIPPVSGG